MLQRDHRRVAFACEKSVETVEQIFVDFRSPVRPALFLALSSRPLNVPCFRLQIRNLLGDRFFRQRGLLFLRRDLRFKLIGLFHQLSS